MTYSADYQSRAAHELAQLDERSPVAEMIVDYGNLRNACRALGT